MNVSLDSIELDEPTLRLIRRAMSPHANASRATRREVKAWAMLTLAREIDLLNEAFGVEQQPAVIDLTSMQIGPADPTMVTFNAV